MGGFLRRPVRPDRTTGLAGPGRACTDAGGGRRRPEGNSDSESGPRPSSAANATLPAGGGCRPGARDWSPAARDPWLREVGTLKTVVLSVLAYNPVEP